MGGLEKMGAGIPGGNSEFPLISMQTKLSISDQSKLLTDRHQTIINETLTKFTKMQAEGGGKISAKDMEELFKDLSHKFHKYESHSEGNIKARSFDVLSHEERVDAFKNNTIFAMEEHEGQTVVAMHDDLKTHVGESTKVILHGAQGTPPRVVENVTVRAFTADETKLMSTIQKTYEVYENTMRTQQQTHQSSEEGVTQTAEVQTTTAPTAKGRTAQTSARAGEPVGRRMDAATTRSEERMLETASQTADASKAAAKKKTEKAEEDKREIIKEGIIKEGVKNEGIKKRNIQRDEGIPPASTKPKGLAG